MSVEYKDSGITFENRNFDGVLWYQPRALSESLSDSVTPSDSLIKGIDPVYADSVSVSDNFVKDFGINLSDSVIARDSKYVVFRDRSGVLFESRPGVVWSEYSEDIVKEVSKPLTDSVTPSDSLIKGISPVYADSVTITDEIVKSFGVNLSDFVTASDSKYVVFEDQSGVLFESRLGVIWNEYSDIIKDISKPIDDSAMVNDEIFNRPGKYLTDLATSSDLLVTKHTDKPLTDTVTTPDSLVKDLTKPLSDSVTADDTTNVLFKDRSDILFENRNGVVWTETRRDLIVKYIEKPLTDTATSVDLITTKHFDQLRTDSVMVTDNIYKHPGLFFWDDYEYSDLITIIELVGSMPYVRPENAVFSEMRIKSVSGREPSNFYEVDEQGEEE